MADAISSVLGFETMILDNQLKIVAGTGRYLKLCGSFESEAFVPEEYLYKYILRVGGTYVVEDVKDPLYGPEVLETYDETGEICCAIPGKSGSVGIIALVSFDDEQRDRLITNQSHICDYLSDMALLLSSFLSQSETLAGLHLQRQMLNDIINATPYCIIAFTKDGYITEINKNASRYLRNLSNLHGILGRHINTVWEGALSFFSLNSEGFDNREVVFNDGAASLIMSMKSIMQGKEVDRYILFFNDLTREKERAQEILKRKEYALDQIYGSSPQIMELKRFISEISDSNSTVLITGESGTGKEVFAHAIHDLSSRSHGPFVTINCGAISESLIESELFGYEGGAFTGASKTGHVGKFEAANGGTVFIDEVGELPLAMQVKLLGVLQRKQLERVGSTRTIDVDIRIIAATNRDLLKMIAQGGFREDLYYRLNVIPLHVPPLRERSGDVPVLAHQLLQKFASQMSKDVKNFSDEALTALINHDWPGNVRELENAVEYSLNICRSSIITREDLPPSLRRLAPSPFLVQNHRKLKSNVENYEQKLLLQGMKDVDDGLLTKEELAEQLGISRASLYRKLKKMREGFR